MYVIKKKVRRKYFTLKFFKSENKSNLDNISDTCEPTCQYFWVVLM